MTRKLFTLIAVLSVACMASAATPDGGYMAETDAYLLYYRINQVNGAVTGFCQAVEPDYTVPSAVRVRRRDLDGTISGNRIVLSADQLFGFGSRRVDGTFRGKNIVLNGASTDGQMVAMTLKPVSESEWNRDVARFSNAQQMGRYNDWCYDRLIAHYESLTGDQEAWTTEQEKAREAIPGLTKRLNDQNEKLADATAKLADAERDLEAARRNKDEAESKAKASRDWRDRLAAEDAALDVETRNEDVTSAKSAVSWAQKNVAETTARIADYNMRLEETPARLEQTHTEMRLLANSPLFASGTPLRMVAFKAKMGATVVARPDDKAEEVSLFAGGTHVYALPTGGRWFVVVLPDDRVGWIDGKYLQHVSTAPEKKK